jgi:hypothetical protein
MKKNYWIFKQLVRREQDADHLAALYFDTLATPYLWDIKHYRIVKGELIKRGVFC